MTVIDVDRDTLIKALSQGTYQTLVLEKHYTDPSGEWIERLQVVNNPGGRSSLTFDKVKKTKEVDENHKRADQPSLE